MGCTDQNVNQEIRGYPPFFQRLYLKLLQNRILFNLLRTGGWFHLPLKKQVFQQFLKFFYGNFEKEFNQQKALDISFHLVVYVCVFWGHFVWIITNFLRVTKSPKNHGPDRVNPESSNHKPSLISANPIFCGNFVMWFYNWYQFCS